MASSDGIAMIENENIGEILRHIPHRYPFLLIDRVLLCEPNRFVRIIKNVTHTDWFLSGATRNVMPEMLVIEALAQAAGVLCHYSGMMSRIGKSIIFFAAIEDATFERDVRAGDQLQLECTLKRTMRGVAKLTATASVGNQRVVDAGITAIVRDLEPTS